MATILFILLTFVIFTITYWNWI